MTAVMDAQPRSEPRSRLTAHPVLNRDREEITVQTPHGPDLANALERSNRLAARTRQLEVKLSELLGEQAWRESGLGAPDDINQLKRRITNLEQEVVTLASQLEERDEELVAARAANRQLISRLNTSH